MAVDPNQLRDEFALPAYVGLSNDAKLAAINAASADTPQVDSVVGRDAFLKATVMAAVRMGQNAALKTAWEPVLSYVTAANQIEVGDPGVRQLLAAAVQAGLLLQAEVDVLGRRNGSRAEQLFGPGTAVTLNDLAKAGV